MCFPSRLRSIHYLWSYQGKCYHSTKGWTFQWRFAADRKGRSCLAPNNGTAYTAVCKLRDALWYIDGHHLTLADRSCHVPQVFKGFVDYNIHESLKHRKRSSLSLCVATLKSHLQVFLAICRVPFGCGQDGMCLRLWVSVHPRIGEFLLYNSEYHYATGFAHLVVKSLYGFGTS